MADTYITKKYEKGTVNIAEDVVSNMVKSAILEVEGVSGLSNTAGAEIAELIGLKTIPKGLTIQTKDEKTIIDAVITVNYGYNIVDVAKKAQANIASVMETSIGIDALEINMHIAGITF